MTTAGEAFPRWIGGAGFFMGQLRSWHGSASLLRAPGKVERSTRCRHSHRSYRTAKACGDRMAERRKLPR